MEWILEVAAQVISAAVGAAVLWWLTKGAGRKMPSAFGRIEYRMNRLYLACGFVAVIIGTASIAVIFKEDFHGQRMALQVLAAVNALMFLRMDIPCTMYYRNHRVLFSDPEIMIIDVWGGLHTCDRSEVESIELNKWTGLYRLKTKGGSSLNVHSHLIGVNSFLDLVRERNHVGRV